MAEPVNEAGRDKEVLVLRELFHGRYDAAETRALLEEFEWDRAAVIKFVFESEPKDVRQIIHGKSENEIVNIQNDKELVESAKVPLISTVTRLFACQDCDHDWWRKCPRRKLVSKCRKCNTKYDPVPRNQEWGWALFDCTCGNEFSGFGQMGINSKCYNCGSMSSPKEIRPPSRRRRQFSRTPHSCDAPDCCNRSTGKLPKAVPPNKSNQQILYDRRNQNRPKPRENIHPGAQGGNQERYVRPTSEAGSWASPGGGPKACVHPKSRAGKKRVLYASTRHQSTGSTVNTFLPQNNLDDAPFYPDLDPIGEDDESVGSNSS